MASTCFVFFMGNLLIKKLTDESVVTDYHSGKFGERQ